MAQYYVIRNKNTGLYFRGKGVNRWGKHYNQASIYRVKAMAEHTIKEVSWRGEQAEIVPIQIIETAADVVAVVRCKDCKHRRTAIRCGLWCGTLEENEYFVEHGDGFYCSFGERKE